jgi:hypothetical protein
MLIRGCVEDACRSVRTASKVTTDVAVCVASAAILPVTVQVPADVLLSPIVLPEPIRVPHVEDQFTVLLALPVTTAVMD